MNTKYDKTYFKNTILDGALSKSPEDLRNVPNFESFLSERAGLIEEFNLINPPENLGIIIEIAKTSGLSPADLSAIAEVENFLRMDNADAEYYERVKNTIKKINYDYKYGDQKLTLSNLDEVYSKEVLAQFERMSKERQSLLNDLNPHLAEYLIHSITNLKSKLNTNLADIQKQFPEPEIQTCDPKAYVEKMLTADIKDLKNKHLLTRYILLNEHDSVKFDEKFARETMIGLDVLGYTQDDLEKDVRKLAKLSDKSTLCEHLEEKINGEDVVTILDEVMQRLKNKFRAIPNILEDRVQFLQSDQNMLKAALLGYLGPMATYLEHVDTPSLDAAFEEMPYKKDALKKAIDLQKSINERKLIHDGLPASDSHSTNCQPFTNILADYLMSPGAEYLPIHHPMLDRTYTMDELVNMADDSESSELFDAIVGHEQLAFDSMWIKAYKGIKSVALSKIMGTFGVLDYNKASLQRRVEHLKKIILMKPYSDPEPFLFQSMPVNEQSVEEVMADHFSSSIQENEVEKPFNDIMLKNYIEICRDLNVQKYHPETVDLHLALTPARTYLENYRGDIIDFEKEDFDTHVPVKTFICYLNDNPEILISASKHLFNCALNPYTKPLTRKFFVYKLLVPLIASLPSQDFTQLSKVRDNEVNFYNKLALYLSEYDEDDDYKRVYLNALIKLGSIDDQKSKQNILFLFGNLNIKASCDDKRARLDAIWKASATDAPKEIISLVRARLLSIKDKGDLALRTLYKSYYDAIKTMYTPKDGEVLDQEFPDEW